MIMKNYKVIFDVDGTQVVSHYSTLAQAQMVANSATKVLGYVARVIAKRVRKATKMVKGVVFTEQQLDDLDAALIIIEEVVCNNCKKCLENYNWAIDVRNWFFSKLNIR